MTAILPNITLETGPAPKHSFIWLHGLGADGGDFVPIADEIELPVAVRYIFPHAPMRPVTINGGYVMRAWYDIPAGAASGAISDNITRQEDSAGIHASQLEIEKLIAQEKQRGVEPGHIFLAGFSQGGAIALHTGLRQSTRLGGIVALSTYLPLARTVHTEASAAAKNTPIFMAHGREDTVISYALGRSSADELLRQGYGLDWHSYAMPHAVCPEEIDDIGRWLRRQLSE